MGQSNGKEKADSGTQAVDGGYLVPQGVYSTTQDYDHAVVKHCIQSRKLAPFYPGLDDEEAYAQAPYNTECPICFLYYPSPLNQTRCCSQQMCTECFVQIKRADPNHTNPPSSEPAACPYCQETNFGIHYKAPPPGVMAGEVKNVAGVAEGADAARERAVESAEGSQGNALSSRRKSFGYQDPDVITIDAIRPDWQSKLAAAEAALTRRANRRIIMRQVGDRLIPVGVSSSRLGSELPPGSSSGPGGAIIIGENSRWTGGLLSSVAGAGRERRGSRGRRDLTQLLQNLGEGGVDMEEMMMMEAMRLSLLEHEEEQRRQAQAQSRQQNQSAQEPQSAPANEGGQELAASGASTHNQAQSAPIAASASSTFGQQQQQTQPRSSSLASESLPATPPPGANPSRRSLTHQELGISNSTMAELSELVEGGLPNISNDAATSTPPRSIAQNATRGSTSPSRAPVNASTPSTPPVGSPSRIGSNPNNPFRRHGASAGNSPVPSRQATNLHTSWTNNDEQGGQGEGRAS